MSETIKLIRSHVSGKPLGEVFVNADSFGFRHIATITEQTGFVDYETALDAWHCLHDEWCENQTV